MNHTANLSKNTASFQATTASQILSALTDYHLKQVGPYQYRAHSPLRPDSDSFGFTLVTSEDGEHGAYFDHVSEDSGTLYELAYRLGIEAPPSRQPIPSTKRVYSGLGDYAAAHGVAVEVFTVAGWSEIIRDNRPALAFTTQTGTRYRFLDGDKPSYKSTPGYQRCWYGLSRAVQIAAETDQSLVICNGEASTVVGQHFGMAACAVTGGEKKALPEALLEELRAVYQGQVLVAFDCLDKGAEAAPALAAQLHQAGLAARAIDLGLGKGGDLADFCQLYTDTAAERLPALPEIQPISTIAESKGLGWNWIHADQLDHLPPMRWLIQDEIPEQALVVLFGQSGAGKSFIALDYSLQIAQHHPVLYIAAEGHAGYANRKIAWCKHHGLDAGQLYFPDNNAVISLLDPQVVEAFIASVLPLQPKLIVFDTLAWCMTGGDENSTSDMQRFITHCRHIQNATGATLLLVHHTGKSGASERGSSALRGGADQMIELSNEDDIMTLSCSKSKETEGFEDRYLARLTLETRPGETSCVWLPTDKVTQTKSDRLSRQQRDVLGILSTPLFIEVGARFAQLAEALPNISRSGMYKILNRLMAAQLGYITQGKRGEPFSITPAGLAALSTVQNRTTGRMYTVSTTSPQQSTETPSLQSTVSTHALACRQKLDGDNAGEMEINVAGEGHTYPALTPSAQQLLSSLAAHTQGGPSAFVHFSRFMSSVDSDSPQALFTLTEQGYLERQPANSAYYRLTAQGWATLGLRVVHVDLSTL
jgi:hypothetical protein